MIPLLGAATSSSGGSPYVAEGAHFDGSACLYRGAVLSGTLDSPTGTRSLFFKTSASDPQLNTSNRWLWAFADAVIGGKPQITSQQATAYLNAGATNAPRKLGGYLADLLYNNDIEVLTDNAFGADDVWHNYIWSWKTDTVLGAREMDFAVDGVEQATTILSDDGGAFDVPWTSLFPVIFSDGFNAGGLMLGGVVGVFSEFYLNTDVYLDLSNPANIAKFRNASTGLPVSLGANGSLPTGDQPAIYFNGAGLLDGTNLGYGGNFTVFGTPTDAGPVT